MFRRLCLFYFVSLPLMCVVRAVSFAVSIIAVPLVYLLKTPNTDLSFNILAAIKLITVRVINQLKPFYHLSLQTFGQNLLHRRSFA